jgi:hypothetical protein
VIDSSPLQLDSIAHKIKMSTPAVVRGDFVYNDAFFAQVDDSKRHPRASVAELTSLLRPESSSTPAAKDQVGHWYQAQLLHYGLAPTKEKNTAKVRLLQAINAGTLAVPDHVSKLERDMKKEFVAAVKKSKSAEKAPTTVAKGKKRTHDEAIPNTKITLTVGGVTISVDQQTAASITSAIETEAPAAKKAKAVKDGATAVKTQKPKVEAPPAKSKKQSETAVTTKPKAATLSKKPEVKSTAIKPTATSASTPASKPAAKKKPQPASKENPKPASKPKDESKATKVKAEPKSKKPTPEATNKSPVRTKQTAIKAEPDRDVNGTYNLYLRSHSPDNVPAVNGPPRISIHHNTCSDTLWGDFTIGSKLGVLRVNDFSLSTLSSSISHFDWRARDLVSGQLRFGRGCEGLMEIGIHGIEKGTFYRLFDGIDVDFGVSTVTRDTDMDWPEWMDRWEDFVKEAYGR